MEKEVRKNLEEAVVYFIDDVEREVLPAHSDESLIGLALAIMLRKLK